MPRDPRAWLWDAREAAVSIQAFVAGMDRDAYERSELVRAAVERKFEVIGEALNQLSKAEPALAARIEGVAQIVAFRNQLAHGYALVDHATVWAGVQQSLPALLTRLHLLLDELDR